MGVVSGRQRTKAPDPGSPARRKDAGSWLVLPDPCRIPVPPWPPESDGFDDREYAVWNYVWTLPQAAIWHRDHMEQTVVLYVRTFLRAQEPSANAALVTTCRQMAIELLLSASALRTMGLVIEGSSDEMKLLNALRPVGKGEPGVDDADIIRGRFTVLPPKEA
jgi:hypothetical protein